MTDFDPRSLIERTLAKAPRWIRDELASDDPALRARAEETLAARLSAALLDKISRVSAPGH